MTASTRLILVKTLHTVVWAIMAFAAFYAIFASMNDRFDRRFFVAVGLISFEVLVLVLNRWKCPLTTVAEKLTGDRAANFDIYLPEWIARHNIRIFTAIFVLGVLANVVKRALG